MQLAQCMQGFSRDGFFESNTEPDAMGPYAIKKGVKWRALQNAALADRSCFLNDYPGTGLRYIFQDTRKHPVDKDQASRHVKP